MKTILILTTMLQLLGAEGAAGGRARAQLLARRQASLVALVSLHLRHLALHPRDPLHPGGRLVRTGLELVGLSQMSDLPPPMKRCRFRLRIERSR